MSTDDVAGAGVSLDDINSAAEAESSKIDLVVEMSSNGAISGELGIADEVVTRLELDLTCASEKLVNLSVFMMHVATKENEFEPAFSTKGDLLSGFAEALEFDFLSRILDSEVTELDKFMRTARENIGEAHKMISSFEHLGETFREMEEKLIDSKESLKQLQDQVSDIREQSAKFQKTSSSLNRDENWNDNKSSNLEDGQFSDVKTKIKMQTAEQQRHILRMLEKSLAREIDLDKKLTESRQIEEELNHRLLSTEQALFFTEEEAIDICNKWFRSDNVAEVLMGISKELLSRLQILQFNLNGSIQRESELRSKLKRSVELLESNENALQKFNSSDILLEQTDSLKASLTEAEEKLILANSEASTLREKMISLEKQQESEVWQSSAKVSVVGSEDQYTVESLKEKVAEAEGRASGAELRCKKLAQRVDSLEKQLVESDSKLQHAMASADASQEKQNMLYATIRDMEILIDNLKLKAFKAENQAECAEGKCIVLSESNAELNEELSFLRVRLKSLEASLNRAKETKTTAAKNIDLRTKVMTDLLMRLAIERQHLHKQMASLTLENKALKLRHDLNVANNHHGTGNGKHLSEVTQKSATGAEEDKIKKGASRCETEAASVPKDVRRIDAGILSFKHILMGMLILLISVAVYLFQRQKQLS